MAAIPKKDKEAIFRKWLDTDSSENSLGRHAIGIVGFVLLIMGYLHRTQIKVAIETLREKLRPTS